MSKIKTLLLKFIVCKIKVKEAIKNLDVMHHEEVLKGIHS